MMTSFATLEDVLTISGVNYTSAEQDRIEALLPRVSNLIRSEGKKAGIDVDSAVETDDAYESVVNTVTCDVVVRIMRQTNTGDPLSQESQSALGYSWSGTFAVPGGGIAMSLLNNEKKALGFKRQRYGGISLWPPKSKVSQ